MDEGCDSSLTEEKISADLDKKPDNYSSKMEQNGVAERTKESAMVSIWNHSQVSWKLFLSQQESWRGCDTTGSLLEYIFLNNFILHFRDFQHTFKTTQM